MPDEQQKVDFPEEEEYRESEDEDFDPHVAADDNVSSSSGDDGEACGNEDIDEGISRKRIAERGHKPKNKKSKHEEDEAAEGIRVLTRSQRIAEEAQEKSVALSRSKTTIDADAVWASLREASRSEASATLEERSNTTADKEDDMITITETYEFAKNIITKEKKVPRHSAEGQAYLKKQAEREKAKNGSSVASSAAESSVTPSGSSTQQSATKSKPGGGPRKRKGSSLEAMAAQGKPKKLNTLEKSKLDWQGFMQEEGIEDDIRRHNKGGYLHKQDFLSRVEEKRYADLKDGQKNRRP
ncbi:bucentaur or craniofacial development-domain-containing protein [Lipomyces orientalis]|uniref:Bucentaur or craniofacial development-domain-containing protein n=1 Tax=Lipomyces orientalis TaxID=1233043 RepID=A0ACC3TYH1_9ASCO